MKLLEVDLNDHRLMACQAEYFKEISMRFGVRFDPHAGEKEAYRTSRQWHVIAISDENEGAALGCGTLRELEGGIGEVKRVWVSDQARGCGVASNIMDWLETRAADVGLAAIRLDTNDTLKEAQALYNKRGYRQIERYNDNPYAHHFYEKRL